ncbi:50S ribosomal protein L15 [Patescibacteria group bacterium]|nr:50S ribosomal protein L15 [Patescibacteria group bacterium]
MTRSKKRIGRGLGSGKGKTGGRGMKGQKARGKSPFGFIGGTLPIYKRLPYRRGVGNPKRTVKPSLIQLSQLASLQANTTVDLNSLLESKIITQQVVVKGGVKIVSGGQISIPLVIKIPISAMAAQAVIKAGGKVDNA